MTVVSCEPETTVFIVVSIVAAATATSPTTKKLASKDKYARGIRIVSVLLVSMCFPVGGAGAVSEPISAGVCIYRDSKDKKRNLWRFLALAFHSLLLGKW